MQRKTKKGFTIVELVIVIAVIGVLTAILVPTFISLTAKANKASDQSLVANLNTALKMQEAEDGEKNPTMHDAVKDLYEQGYRLEQLVSKSKEDLVYSLKENRFYLSGDSEVKEATKQYEFWKIYKEVPATQTFSIYAANGWTSTTANVKVGFDAGYNENIAEVKYENDNAQEVVIRTNYANTTLTIKAEHDTVNHYGKVGKVDAQKIDMNCYNEYGTAAYVKVTEGKVVAKAGGTISVVFAANNDKDAVAVIKETNGTIEKGLTVIQPVSDTNEARTNGIPLEYSIDGETAADSQFNYDMALAAQEAAVEAIAQEAINTVIENTAFAGVAVFKSGEATKLMTLEAFRDSVNAGTDYAGCTVKLLDNIDLNDIEWTPIGTTGHPFSGVFDGQNYTIKNYKIRGAGENVGLALFGYIEGTNNTDVATFTKDTSLSSFYNDSTYTVNLPDEKVFTCVVKNLNVSGADVDTTADGWTAAVVANVRNATISNIRLSKSTILGNCKVGGIVGALSANYCCFITNCTTASDVQITARTENHCAGILSRVLDPGHAIVANCTNNATINCAGVNGSGIAGQSKGTLFYNDTNNGSITGKTRAAGIATDCAGSVFINCTNTGYIKATNELKNSNGTDSTAGIASYLSSTGHNVIANCQNSGTVEGTCPYSEYGSKIAGIVAGGLTNSDHIINNSNTGTLINHAENGKVYDICNLSSVANEVTPSDLSGLNSETATDNKNIKVNSSLVLSENDNTVTFNGQEKLEFVNSPKYLTLDLTNANKNSFVLVVNDTEVTLTNGGDNYVTISGEGNTVKVDENQAVKNLTVLNDNTQSASSFNILGNATRVVLKGNGLVNGEIAENATVERVGFSGNGTFVLTNRGTISHKTEGEYGAEHTISTINSCNITIHNYGTIEAKKNENDVASYALLFYGGATVKLYAYNGSNIISEKLGVIATQNGTVCNVYYEDGAKVTSHGSEMTYPQAFGYSCTVTKMN